MMMMTGMVTLSVMGTRTILQDKMMNAAATIAAFPATTLRMILPLRL